MKRSDDGQSPGERAGPATNSDGQDPRLEVMVEAFARGDYARVRADAREIERGSHDGALKQAARALVERTNPDPLALALLALAALLLVFLGGWWMLEGRPPDGYRPPAAPHSLSGTGPLAGRGAWARQLPGSFDPGIPLISRRACFHARCTTQDIER
jgi:hypothetical protein